jgi:hypothetical protein
MTSNVTDIRDGRGRFVKGQSGNPSGKPSTTFETPEGEKLTPTELYLKNAAEVHRILLNIIRKTDPKNPKPPQLTAIKEYNDRAYGKPHQSVSTTTETREEPTLDVERLSRSALREIVNAARLETANDEDE